MSILIAGMNISLHLKRRRDFLSEIILFLSTASIEIDFANLTITDILKKISASSTCRYLDFLHLCLENIETGDDFDKAWKSAVENSELPFKREEREKLKSLGCLVGTSDASGQQTVFALFKENFTFYLKKAEDVYEKYGKVTVTVSGFLGMGAFLIMI